MPRSCCGCRVVLCHRGAAVRVLGVSEAVTTAGPGAIPVPATAQTGQPMPPMPIGSLLLSGELAFCVVQISPHCSQLDTCIARWRWLSCTIHSCASTASSASRLAAR